MERNLQIDRNQKIFTNTAIIQSDIKLKDPNHEENLWTRFIKFVGDKSGLQ
ncbi:hypothetical protein [Leptospira kirschneri]|uniref:hypothetical protein n=1 Tax=Leptospira kirschneri TaxID=29507 RepID=UPI000AE8EF97|nr:hypothetical protein [Leptospira kirschneri]